MHLKSSHGLIAVERVLDAACQYVVNARMAVGRGRPLEKYKLRTAFALADATKENVVLLPLGKNLLVGLRQVETLVFGKFLSHYVFSFTIKWFFNSSFSCRENSKLCSLPSQFKAQRYKKKFSMPSFLHILLLHGGRF